MTTTQKSRLLNRLSRRWPVRLALIVAVCFAYACGSDTAPQLEYVPTPTNQSPTAAPTTPTPQTSDPLPTATPPTPQTSDPLPTATPNVPPTPKPTPTPRVQAPPVPSPTLPSMSEGTGTRPPDRDLEELATRLRGVTASDPSPSTAAPLSQGAQDTFWITDLDDGSAHSITATLHVVSDNAYWFVENDVDFDQQGLEEAAQIFESRVRTAVVRTFGDIRNPGIDGDPRLVVLHSKLNGAAGYFGSADAFPSDVHPHSNEREIIYMDIEALPSGHRPLHGRHRPRVSARGPLQPRQRRRVMGERRDCPSWHLRSRATGCSRRGPSLYAPIPSSTSGPTSPQTVSLTTVPPPSFSGTLPRESAVTGTLPI